MALIAVFVALAMLGVAVAVEGRRVLSAIDLRRRPSPVGSVLGLLVTFAVIYGVGLVAFGLAVSVFDRYLWPLVLPIAIVLLWRPTEEGAKDVLDGKPHRFPILGRLSGSPARHSSGWAHCRRYGS